MKSMLCLTTSGPFLIVEWQGELPFLEGLLCAKLYTHPSSSGIKPRLREVKSLAQGHKMSEWQNSLDLNPGADAWAWENGHRGWQWAWVPDPQDLTSPLQLLPFRTSPPWAGVEPGGKGRPLASRRGPGLKDES